MTISLTDLIADIEAKIAAADSSTSTDELLKIIKAARAANTIQNVYDSSGVMPVDSASVGNVLMSASDNSLYVLDSASGSWSSIAGSGGAAGPTYSYQGENYGYATIGNSTDASYDQFAFASDGNGADVGDMTIARYSGSNGQVSATHGYVGGGQPTSPIQTDYRIDKFSFSSLGNATDVGDMIHNTSANACGMSTETAGYAAAADQSNRIEKFSFTVDGNSVDTADLTAARSNNRGSNTSSTHGYTAGGMTPTNLNSIDKFNFTTEGNATDVGDLASARGNLGSASSATHGYQFGGFTYPPDSWKNNIEKFPFAVDANTTDVGDLVSPRNGQAGQSSTTHGYGSGGSLSGATNNIEKFSFSSDGNSTSVATLSFSRQVPTGHQS